jgi:hypothetical protein
MRTIHVTIDIINPSKEHITINETLEFPVRGITQEINDEIEKNLSAVIEVAAAKAAGAIAGRA